jgi:hypothetical protein
MLHCAAHLLRFILVDLAFLRSFHFSTSTLSQYVSLLPFGRLNQPGLLNVTTPQVKGPIHLIRAIDLMISPADTLMPGHGLLKLSLLGIV